MDDDDDPLPFFDLDDEREAEQRQRVAPMLSRPTESESVPMILPVVTNEQIGVPPRLRDPPTARMIEQFGRYADVRNWPDRFMHYPTSALISIRGDPADPAGVPQGARGILDDIVAEDVFNAIATNQPASSIVRHLSLQSMCRLAGQLNPGQVRFIMQMFNEGIGRGQMSFVTIAKFIVLFNAAFRDNDPTLNDTDRSLLRDARRAFRISEELHNCLPGSRAYVQSVPVRASIGNNP